MSTSIVLKLNKDLGTGHPVGTEITLEARSGIPVNRFWRRRLQDSAVDKCVEIVKQTKKGGKA